MLLFKDRQACPPVQHTAGFDTQVYKHVDAYPGCRDHFSRSQRSTGRYRARLLHSSTILPDSTPPPGKGSKLAFNVEVRCLPHSRQCARCWCDHGARRRRARARGDLREARMRHPDAVMFRPHPRTAAALASPPAKAPDNNGSRSCNPVAGRFQLPSTMVVTTPTADGAGVRTRTRAAPRAAPAGTYDCLL